MDALSKIQSLNPFMRYELAEDYQLRSPSTTSVQCQGELAMLKEHFPVTHAHLPGGKTIPLLKTMQTSVCENDCNYCCFRKGRDTERVLLTPDELADAIIKLDRAGIARGVFLSSGVFHGGITSQDRLIATAEVLRFKRHYQGYIHLKIMPGAEFEQVLRCMELADRVSINLESPTPASLARLAPHKVFFDQLLQPLKWIAEIRQNDEPKNTWKQRWPSSCTQFVVGVAGETDLELLSLTSNLYQQYGLARAYYSGFSPVVDTPFENLPPLNPWREHRLYQAFFLMRDYQIDLEELEFMPAGDLPLEKDPKMFLAERQLLEQPIEINTADYKQLLRVPGIGPNKARLVMEKRQVHKIREPHQLHALGIPLSKASPFILLDGQRPDYQESLFAQIVV